MKRTTIASCVALVGVLFATGREVPASAQEALLAQAGAASAEQNLPGTWSATTPQATTTVFMKFQEVTKNPDGSLSFTGRIWTEGAVVDGGGDLNAKLADNKLTFTFHRGSGSLVYTGKELRDGHLQYGNFLLQGMVFAKK